MKKRGQFFLIAALLISGIAIGFSTIYSESQIDRSDAQVFDLTDELESELQQVQDGGVFTGSDPETIKANLKAVADHYQNIHPDSNVVIFYGNGDEVDGIQQLTSWGDEFALAGATEAIVDLPEETFPDSTDETNQDQIIGDDSNTYPDGTETDGSRSILSTTQTSTVETEELTSIQKEKRKARKRDGKKVKIALKIRKNKKTQISEEERHKDDSERFDDLIRNEKSIPIEEIERDFELKQGDNFYLVVRKKVNNEQVTAYG